MRTGIIINDFYGTAEISMPGYLLKQRKILLTGEINADMANDFLGQMLYLLHDDPEEEIKIYLNSHGGEITAGMSIVDIIQNAAVPIHIYVTGEAASMAAVILACGKHRYMLPHARTMIHEPLLSGTMHQNASSLQSMSTSLIQTKKMINELLAVQTGKTMAEIDQLTQHDYWMDAGETVAFGLADGICQTLV